MHTISAKKDMRLPGIGRTFITVLIHPCLLVRGIRCIWIILTKFFLFQYRSARIQHIPVSQVEHELDSCIPFNPCFVRIYLDFTAFWIRIAGFFGIGNGKEGRKLAANFISSITEIYSFAFQIYRKNLSTTARPLHKKGFHFRLIHLVDPHLMCIPSLHVMLMVHSYTVFIHYIQMLGEEDALHDMADHVCKGALLITEAVLYVKQHSIICIAAALYAMCCFDPKLFSANDAENFITSLFGAKEPGDIPAEYAPYYTKPLVNTEDSLKLHEYITSLFRHFMETRNIDWTVPILEYLKTLPQNNRTK